MAVALLSPRHGCYSDKSAGKAQGVGARKGTRDAGPLIAPSTVSSRGWLSESSCNLCGHIGDAGVKGWVPSWGLTRHAMSVHPLMQVNSGACAFGEALWFDGVRGEQPFSQHHSHGRM